MATRVGVVTGSSSGIGRQIAIELAEDGIDIVVHAARNMEGANEVANLVRQTGREALVVQQDFSDARLLDDFVKRCWDWKSSVDVFVNNAGADVLTGDAVAWDFETKLNAVLQVDVVATLVLSRDVGKRMRDAFAMDSIRRSIINIGWDQAKQGMAGDCGEMFAASKGAIMAASKSLAQSLAPGVRVNCIAPGWIQTSWGEGASSEWQSVAKHDSLLERWGTPQDVAAIARFLASESAEFINGQVICANGGFRYGGQSLNTNKE